jgi:cellulose biosynthesis protein BcsQ
MKILSIFNNKGGVGKTTYLYHVAHLIARTGKKVLMVDCDSQCNLTAYSMQDSQINQAWGESRGNSIYRIIEPVYRGIGDIRKRGPTELNGYRQNISIVPGDLLLNNFEDVLGESWNGAKGGSEPNIRTQAAIYRYIKWAGEQVNADLIMVDLGPNLGALNRVALGGSDYFIVPVAPDLFSIRGTENLGSKLLTWRKEWEQCNDAWDGNDIEIPNGKPVFIGYVVQQHNVRRNSEGMTQGWQLFGNRLEDAIQKNIIDKLPSDQVLKWDNNSFNLGLIPNLHSLIPYSLEARKPVFDCTASDGLRGAHISTARESISHFENISNRIISLI